MFPDGYFPARYFPNRYWPIGAKEIPPAPLITSGGWSEWPLSRWPPVVPVNEDDEIMLLSLMLTELVQ